MVNKLLPPRDAYASGDALRAIAPESAPDFGAIPNGG